MFCTNCGKELNDADQFCRNCGQKVATNDTINETITDNITTATEDIAINTASANNFEYTNVTNSNQNSDNQFSKVIITRVEGSKLFNRTPMKIIFNGGIITQIVAGEVLELEFPVGQHSVVFDANGDVQDYVINVEKANSMIYIDIAVISELAHSSGIPKIQSVRNEDNVVQVNAKYKFNYNEILNAINNPKNINSNSLGTYGPVSIACVLIGLFIMGYPMSFCAITFGFLGMRRSKVLKNEKGDFLSLIGIIGGFIELGVMISQTLTF